MLPGRGILHLRRTGKHHHPAPLRARKPQRPLRVRLLRLDNLVATGEIRAPHFVNIDLEGHAHKALAGAQAAITSARPIIIVAFHSDLEAGGVHAILDPLDYVAARITTHPGSTHQLSGHDFIFRPARRG